MTQAGWLSGLNASKDMTFAFGDNAATDRLSHDFSKLGTQTSKRDEADLQVNLDPSGFEVLNRHHPRPGLPSLAAHQLRCRQHHGGA